MTSRERSVIHLNVADFAVAVEQALDARLRGRPLIVAPEHAPRATVFDMSEPAFQAGVRKGMRLDRARCRCRDAAVLPPHPDRYERAMRALRVHARPYSPLVEQADDNGHLFVDVTGTGRLFGPPQDIAWRMRRAIQGELGFVPVWAVAPNKLLAKVATRLAKPCGERIVTVGDEAAFLSLHPLSLLPGVESEELARLHAFHLTRIGEVAALDFPQLEVAVGKRARALHEAVRGVDEAPVLSENQRPPLASAAHEFAEDSNDAAEVRGVLHRLAERIGAELRERKLGARRVGVILDYADGARVVRSASTPLATADDFRLFDLARLALERAWLRRVRIRHVKVAADRLATPPAQLDLFDLLEERDAEREALRRRDGIAGALDTIRRRFGPEAVAVGRTMVGGARP